MDQKLANLIDQVSTLVTKGHPTRAFELGREGLKQHPGTAPLMYYVALALARGGNVASAAERVAELLCLPNLDLHWRIEALCLEGRLFKDRYERSHDAEERKRHALDSAQRYLQAWTESEGAWYPGINAATMSLLGDDRETALRLAKHAIERAQKDLEQPNRGDDYWLLATLGEGYFVQGNLPEAAPWYRKAVQEAKRKDALGDIGAMRRQCLLLKEKLEITDEFLRLFHVGSVVAFAGHMIDNPARTGQDGPPARFPSDKGLEDRVRMAIREAIEELDVRIGYCSAACGSDILFAECLLERKPRVNLELHIVLPFAKKDFYATSIDFGLETMAGWRDRFEEVLKQASEVHSATTEPFLNDEVLFDFVNRFTQGLSVVRARERGVDAHALVVLDEAAEQKFGGTAYFLKEWQRDRRPAKIIDLARLRKNSSSRGVTSAAAPSAVPGAAAVERMPRQIKAMLFADVKNFSSLGDDQAPQFVPPFMDMVFQVLKASENRPYFWNTWGDGLYVVFERVRDCADFALRLRDQVGELEGTTLGLPDRTPLRIGVHAGPVFEYLDPILGRFNYFGSHVNRTARIEPMTLPGCAFASEQFAALLAIEASKEFDCEYIGVESLPKGFDRCPLYRLERK